MKRIYSGLSILILTLMLQSCSATNDSFKLTIAHLNDTHSHLDAAPVVLTINGVRSGVELGGMARIKTAVDDLRSRRANFMLLHAGDAVQGTLYFNLFKGKLDFELLNQLGVDAMTFGNHEFDRGADAIPAYLATARFPLLSSNIDFSREPAIAAAVSPYVIRDFGGERVALVGVTTENTPISTMTVGKTVFNDSHASVAKTVRELYGKGVNKIIIISHLGYAEDKKLAAEVDGIDVIVGGHSHTLLGDRLSLNNIGLMPEGAYPTVVKSPQGAKTLVLQAWQWGFILGGIDIDFSNSGEIVGYADQSRWIIGDRFSQNGSALEVESGGYQEITAALKTALSGSVVPENSRMKEFITPYAGKLLAYRNNIIAKADQDLIRGMNSGPGPLVADSMLFAVPSAQVALLNFGGVRKNLHAGEISVGDVMELLPFGGTLNVVDLSGAELKDALEEGVEFLLKKFADSDPVPLPYIAGGRYAVNTSELFGKRVLMLEVKDSRGIYQPVQPAVVYRAVVNNFMAAGGDGFSSIKHASKFRFDTGIIEAEACIRYLKAKGRVSNPVEPRIAIVPSKEASISVSTSTADNFSEKRKAVKRF